MHTVRVHTHPNASVNAAHTRKQKQRQSREVTLEKKKAYNKEYRARVKLGLPGAKNLGIRRYRKGMKSDTANYKRMKYLERRDQFAARGLNAHGEPYKMSPAALRNVRLAQAKRREREGRILQAAFSDAAAAQARPTKRVRFVYPLPTEKQVQPQVTEQEIPWVHAQLHHCPHCGENLTRWKRE